ncbi:MAG: type IV pilin protein [Steroidobacterales bacterium]
MKVSHFSSAIEPSSGFSLIELMIVLAIGALLAAIALPMYTKQVQHSRRVEARTAVLDIAGREERYLSVSGTYTIVPASLGYAAGAPNFPMAVGNGYYQVNVAVAVPAPPNPPTYTVSATPTAGSSQLKDTACQYFSVDNTGKQFSSATGAAGADTSTICWQ